MSAFKVDIALGNDTMRTPEEVADALTKVADTLRSESSFPDTYMPIQDINGNTVGSYWSVLLTPLGGTTTKKS